MKITIDTEKDSKEDILEIMKVLQKILSMEEGVVKPSKIKEQVPEEIEAVPKEEKADELDKTAEELFNVVAKKSEKKEEIKGVPKSVQEAFDIAEELETY